MFGKPENKSNRDTTVQNGASMFVVNIEGERPRTSESRTEEDKIFRSSSRRSMQSGPAKGRGGCCPSPMARVQSSLDAGLRSPSMSPNVKSEDAMLQLDDLPSGLPIEDI